MDTSCIKNRTISIDDLRKIYPTFPPPPEDNRDFFSHLTMLFLEKTIFGKSISELPGIVSVWRERTFKNEEEYRELLRWCDLVWDIECDAKYSFLNRQQDNPWPAKKLIYYENIPEGKMKCAIVFSSEHRRALYSYQGKFREPFPVRLPDLQKDDEAYVRWYLEYIQTLQRGNLLEEEINLWWLLKMNSISCKQE